MEFDELLEHLDDFLDLVRSEGFTALAGQIENFRAAVHRNRGAFDLRERPHDNSTIADADAARAERLPRNVRDS